MVIHLDTGNTYPTVLCGKILNTETMDYVSIHRMEKVTCRSCIKILKTKMKQIEDGDDNDL